MKELARLLLVLAVGIAGCAQPERDQLEEQTNTDLLEFAKEYAAAWSNQDAVQYASFYSANGALKINDDAPAVGREAVAALAQSYMTALPDMIVSLDSLVVVEGIPQFHWTLDATDSGPGGSGNRLHISGFEEWTLDEQGLIVLSQGHMDTNEYQRQLEEGYSEE